MGSEFDLGRNIASFCQSVDIPNDKILILVGRGVFGQSRVEQIKDNLILARIESFNKPDQMLGVLTCAWIISKKDKIKFYNIDKNNLSYFDNPPFWRRDGGTPYYEKDCLVIGIEDIALGDTITAFPALYEIAKLIPLSVWFDLKQLYDLWGGPPIFVPENPPDVKFNILGVAHYFNGSGLHMVHGWYRYLGLQIPKTLPKITVAGQGPSGKEIFDVIISPYSASGRQAPTKIWHKVWPYENWCRVIDALVAFGLSVAVCGVFTRHDGRNRDEKFWGDRPVATLDGLPLAELVGYLRGARCVATIDNGIGHLAHLLSVPHAHVIHSEFNPFFVANRNANAVWISEPFVADHEYGHALRPERVLEAIFTVLGSFGPVAYVGHHPDLVAAQVNGWHHWVEYGVQENRHPGYIPFKLNVGSWWRDWS